MIMLACDASQEKRCLGVSDMFCTSVSQSPIQPDQQQGLWELQSKTSGRWQISHLRHGYFNRGHSRLFTQLSDKRRLSSISGRALAHELPFSETFKKSIFQGLDLGLPTCARIKYSYLLNFFLTKSPTTPFERGSTSSWSHSRHFAHQHLFKFNRRTRLTGWTMSSARMRQSEQFCRSSWMVF